MQPLSPISVHERYSSPTAGSAKRRLFGEDPPKEMLMDRIITEGTKLKIAPSSSITAENISISPGHSLLTMATAIVTGTTGHKVTVPLHGNILMHLFFFEMNKKLRNVLLNYITWSYYSCIFSRTCTLFPLGVVLGSWQN